MVQTIEGKDRQKYPDILDQIFRARYETFILGRQWSLPAKNGREVDQYDNDDAVYFADFDETGFLQGSVRLTPTVTSSLTADYFPHLCHSETLLRDPLVYEGTRYIAVPRKKTYRNNRIVKSRILGALTEWAWTSGITHIQTIIDAALFKSFKEINSQVFSLGPPQNYGGGLGTKGGGSCLAIRFPVTKRAIAEIRSYSATDTFSRPEHRDHACSDSHIKKVA